MNNKHVLTGESPEFTVDPLISASCLINNSTIRSLPKQTRNIMYEYELNVDCKKNSNTIFASNIQRCFMPAIFNVYICSSHYQQFGYFDVICSK